MASTVAHYALSFLLSRQVDLLLPRQSTDADHLCLVCTFHADAQHVSVDEIPHIVQCDAWVKTRLVARRGRPARGPRRARRGCCAVWLWAKNVSSLAASRGARLVLLRAVLGANVLCSIDPWCTSHRRT